MSPAALAQNGRGTQQGGPVVPFLAGSWEYTEPMFTDSLTPGAAPVEFIRNITPGGFLRGITLSVTAAGGTNTTGVLNGDLPWSIIQSISLESVDGVPILYPMSGYQMYLVSRFTRPWSADPATDGSYAATINPQFRIKFYLESRMTIGCVNNTDARAQYRIRYTVAAFNPGIVTTTGDAVAPVLTINGALETWAQPPAADLAGNGIVQIPDGVALQRFISRQGGIATNTGTSTVQSNRVGNLIRTLILEVRTSAGVRADLTADPIRFRLDNTQLSSENRDHVDYRMETFYNNGAPGMTVGVTRPTGVYVFHRWHNPGAMVGPYWLPTTEASYLTFEINGGPAAGTLTILTEDLAPVGPVPAHLMGL